MELTIDQALQQGVASHREGKLQDAERLYRAILQAQPKIQMPTITCVLAMAVGKPIEAIPLKLALENNPQIEQFWLSYIDALMLERFEEAKRVLVEGERSVCLQRNYFYNSKSRNRRPVRAIILPNRV